MVLFGIGFVESDRAETGGRCTAPFVHFAQVLCQDPKRMANQYFWMVAFSALEKPWNGFESPKKDVSFRWWCGLGFRPAPRTPPPEIPSFPHPNQKNLGSGFCRFLGVIEVRTWDCFPLTPQSRGSFLCASLSATKCHRL